MIVVLFSLLSSLRSSLRTRAALRSEVLALRHQLLVLRRAIVIAGSVCGFCIVFPKAGCTPR
jgi:hypothetical protein